MLLGSGHKIRTLIIIWFSLGSVFGDGAASTNPHPFSLELAPETKTVSGDLAPEILLPSSAAIPPSSVDDASSLSMKEGSSLAENFSSAADSAAAAASDVTLNFKQSARILSQKVEVADGPPSPAEPPLSKEQRPDAAEGAEQQPSADSEVMPSFDEWKKKMLADQDGKKAPVLPGSAQSGKKPGGSRRRNYSSVECGAKIVASNQEADSPSHVLNEQLDEYMLNPCRAKIWFIVELCESIQAAQIEVGNLELFSSTPREFSVAWSDRFPTRDWSSLGTFEAPDQRSLHQFPLHMQGFGKFIKVEMLSHHGSEHYCPISVVRVYGTSMVDEYEEMETADRNQPADEMDLKPDSPDLFGSAKEAMLRIVKNVLILEEGDPAALANDTSELEPNTTRSNESDYSDYLAYCQSSHPQAWLALTSPRPANELCHFLQEACPLESPAPNRTSSPIVTTSYSSQPPAIQPTRTLSESEVQASGQPSQQTEISPTSTLSAAEAPSLPAEDPPPESFERDSVESSTEGGELPTTPLEETEAKPEHIPVGSAGQQKESIFLRMGNRIRALELNMSLSSRYLQELSQRYRRQMEEMQRSFNRTVAALNETARAAWAKDKAQQELIESLRLQLANLTQGLEGLVADRERLQARMAAEHLALVLGELCLVMLCLTCCQSRSRKLHHSSSESPKELLIIEPPEPKVKKKKNKKSAARTLHRSQSNPSLPPLPPPLPPPKSSQIDASPAAGLLFTAPSAPPPPLDPPSLPLEPPPSPHTPRKVHRTPSV